MTGIRLQLALAKAGLASRRHAEELIVAGRVAVNGKIVNQLGSRIDPVSDRVTVDGNPVLREAPAYYLMNKPKGYVTTAEDPEGRPTVFSLLKGMAVRLFSVGRLDYNTEGALLLTNDGELAHALMHPSRGVAKVYHAKFRGVVSREQITMLRRGVELPPARPLDKTGKPLPTAPGSGKVERSAPAQVIPVTTTGRHTWLQFILHEGKNRQIHRMAEAVGSSLLKLMRVEYAGLTLGELAVGEYRPLQSREVLELRQSVGLRPFAAQEGPQKPRAKSEPASGAAAESRARAPGRTGRQAPERSTPSERSGSPPRAWQSDRAGQADRSGPPPRAGQPDRAGQSERSGPRPRAWQSDKPGQSERSGSPSRAWQSERSGPAPSAPRRAAPATERDRPAGGWRAAADRSPRSEWSQEPPRRERGAPSPAAPARVERGSTAAARGRTRPRPLRAESLRAVECPSAPRRSDFSPRQPRAASRLAAAVARPTCFALGPPPTGELTGGAGR